MRRVGGFQPGSVLTPVQSRRTSRALRVVTSPEVDRTMVIHGIHRDVSESSIHMLCSEVSFYFFGFGF